MQPCRFCHPTLILLLPSLHLAYNTCICRSARLSLPVEQALRVVSALSPTALLQLLRQVFIVTGREGGRDDRSSCVNYGCRLAAVELLREVLLVLKPAAAVGEQQLLAELHDQLKACLVALLVHVCGAKQQMDKAGGFAGADVVCCKPEAKVLNLQDRQDNTGTSSCPFTGGQHGIQM